MAKITIDELARMVKEGFDRTATKDDVKAVQTDLKKLEERLTKRIDDIQNREIEKLRDDMRVVKTKLGIR